MNLSDLRAKWAITNVQAMARVVRQKESNQTGDAYTLINGGAHFTPPADYSQWRHPWHGIPTTQGARATGAYQHLGTTWASLAQRYGIPDFSPPNQDAGFVGGLIDRGALEDVIAGRFEDAVAKLRKEWTSLPGAAESRPDWTMDKAKQVFRQYGGGVAMERDPRPDIPSAPLPELPASESTRVRDDMGILGKSSALDVAATLAGAFNPLLGVGLGLAGNILKSTSPLLQEKVAKEINRHTDDPEIGKQVAADFAQLVVSQAKALTGKADDFQAAAAITSDPAQAENLQKLEANLDAELDRLAKAGDKASTWDQAMWDAQNKGRQTVSTIAIEEKKAGLWDMTRTLVLIGGVTASLIVLMIAAAIVYQSVWGDEGVDVGLVGLGGPLLMAAIQLWKDVFAYRFDGTKESTAQSQAIIAAATKKGV